MRREQWLFVCKMKIKKKCTQCKKPKILTDFSRDKRGREQATRRPKCKQCENENRNKYRLAHIELARKKSRARYKTITLAQKAAKRKAENFYYHTNIIDKFGLNMVFITIRNPI